MIEVWEESLKTGSGNADGKVNNEYEIEKENDKKADVNGRTCDLCGKVFKSTRARMTHERQCGSREEGKKKKRGFGSRGVVVLEANGDTEAEEEIEEVEEELRRLEPQVASIGDEISKDDLDQLSRELEGIEAELNTKVDFEALTKMSEDHEYSLSRLEDSIRAMNSKMVDVIQEMEDSGGRYGTYRKMLKDMKKLDERITEILEEIGFGESLNVAKIPPNILESVYESTMEDIIDEIRRNYGSIDAENIINRTLEDVRTRTSGSELFYFDGRSLRTRNFVRSLEERLISAKQVQTTYDELLGKFLEYLPGYKAKNFRAMIKLKSQEYAVDKATFLMEGHEILRRDMENLINMVGIVSSRQNSMVMDIKNIVESKLGRDDIKEIQALIEDIRVKQGNFDETVVEIKKQMEEDKKAFSEKLEGILKRVEAMGKALSQERKREKGKRPAIKDEGKKDKKKAKTTGSKAEEESMILSVIPDEGFTMARIKKELGESMENEKIEECLQSLTDKGLMSTVKHGRHTVFVRNKNEKKTKKSNGGEK